MTSSPCSRLHSAREAFSVGDDYVRDTYVPLRTVKTIHLLSERSIVRLLSSPRPRRCTILISSFDGRLTARSASAYFDTFKNVLSRGEKCKPKQTKLSKYVNCNLVNAGSQKDCLIITFPEERMIERNKYHRYIFASYIDYREFSLRIRPSKAHATSILRD